MQIQTMIIKSVLEVPAGKQVHLLVDKDVTEKSWYIDIIQFATKLSGKGEIYMDMQGLRSHLRLPAALIVFKHVYRLTSYAQGRPQVKLFFVKSFEIVSLLSSIVIGSDLASKPANKLSPDQFCKETKKLLKNAKVSWWNEKKIEEHGLGLVLAVGKGAENPPRFLKIVLKSANPQAKTVYLVGKGVIFDSGGYNLKSGSSMASMKGDKTGGSIVVSIIHYFMNLQKCAYNLVGIIPLVENMISHKAQKVGDVYTSFNGKTVEILNTDAEGRLILADALAYSSTKDPAYIFDFATLTGWAQILHCHTSYVYFATNDDIAKEIDISGNRVGERSIRLPNWPEYKRFTKSDIADYKNVGFECQSDGFMASMFLMNFVKDPNSWVHFDITHSDINNHHFTNAAATAIDMISRRVLK